MKRLTFNEISSLAIPKFKDVAIVPDVSHLRYEPIFWPEPQLAMPLCHSYRSALSNIADLQQYKSLESISGLSNMKFHPNYLTWFNPGKKRLRERMARAYVGSKTYVDRLAREAKRKRHKKAQRSFAKLRPFIQEEI
jgi:hypothetical protein